MGFDFQYMLDLMPILLKYLGTTMEMATWGMLFSDSFCHFGQYSVFKVPVLDQLVSSTSAFPWNTTA